MNSSTSQRLYPNPTPSLPTALPQPPVSSARPLLFACSPDNDLFRAALANGMNVRRLDTPQAAVDAACEGDGVLLLADGYPAKTTALNAALFQKVWEYWASNADAGWGSWSIKSGWTQSWITTALALKRMRTSLWDLTAGSRVSRHFHALRTEMIPDAALAASEEMV